MEFINNIFNWIHNQCTIFFFLHHLSCYAQTGLEINVQIFIKPFNPSLSGRSVFAFDDQNQKKKLTDDNANIAIRIEHEFPSQTNRNEKEKKNNKKQIKL